MPPNAPRVTRVVRWTVLFGGPSAPLMRAKRVSAAATIVPPGSPVSVFLTRAELDCFAALGAVMREYRVQRLLAGGGHNPFDQFDYVSGVGPARRGEYVKTARLSTGSSFDLGDGR